MNIIKDMEAHFETTLFIKNIFDSIVDLVPSFRLEIKEDGLYVCCIETNGCCIVSLFISKKDMTKYKIEKETSVVIQLTNMLKKLKELDKLKPIVFKYKDGCDKISFYQTNASGRASKHDSRLLSIDDIETSRIPDIKYYAEVSISTDDLTKILKILLISNEVCKISSFKNKKMLVLSSNGEFDSGREELPIDDDSFITDNQHYYFSIPYLVKFLKAGPLSRNATICLSNDNPICIKFEIYNSYIHYYLSPKIEDDEDVAQMGDDEEKDDVSHLGDDEEKDDDPKIEIKLNSDSESEYEEVLVTDSENEVEQIISDSDSE